MHIVPDLLNSWADIFNYFRIARKFIPIFTLTNNILINIFIPMKSGLPPSQSGFEKIHLVGSWYGTLADLMLYKLCFIFVFTVMMMFVKCLWICLHSQPQIRPAGHLKKLTGHS